MPSWRSRALLSRQSALGFAGALLHRLGQATRGQSVRLASELAPRAVVLSESAVEGSVSTLKFR